MAWHCCQISYDGCTIDNTSCFCKLATVTVAADRSSPVSLHCCSPLDRGLSSCDGGRAVSTSGSSFGDFSDCIFSGNSAVGENGNAGAIAALGFGSIAIRNTLFEANQAPAGLGGGMQHTNGALLIFGCTFTSNNAMKGGALYLGVNSFKIYETAVISNTATDGAGLYFYAHTIDVNIPAPTPPLCDVRPCRNCSSHRVASALSSHIVWP